MRTYTVLIPHYKTKITAYCIHKILKHSGGRADIVVVSNSGLEGMEYLEPFKDNIKVLFYPDNLMQSHGLAFDYAIENTHIQEYFITLESDSYPTHDHWLRYYDNLIAERYDMAASLLQLSGGTYYHPAGAMYRLDNWHDAKQWVEGLNAKYHYLPNCVYKNGFPHHTMLYKESSIDIKTLPIHEDYKTLPLADKIAEYLPIAQSVFHQGMGFNQESYLTYGQRNPRTGQYDFISVWTEQLIYRMGYEPGQFFGYWHIANKKKVHNIPTAIQWMHNRVNQQQEGTMTENGVYHIWGGTAMTLTDASSVADITEHKRQVIDALYNEITIG